MYSQLNHGDFHWCSICHVNFQGKYSWGGVYFIYMLGGPGWGTAMKIDGSDDTTGGPTPTQVPEHSVHLDSRVVVVHDAWEMQPRFEDFQAKDLQGLP